MQSKPTVESFHSALQQHYKEQQILARNPAEKELKTLMEHSTYKAKYETIIACLVGKGVRMGGFKDPQDNTAEDTYSAAQWLQLNEHLMNMGTKEATRDQAMGLLAHAGVGRSDDVRNVFLPDLVKPRRLGAVGEMVGLLELLSLLT